MKFVIGCTLLLLLCGVAHAKPSAPTRLTVVFLDDTGCVNVGACRTASGMVVTGPVPATPTLDQLAAEGVNFTGMWAHANCAASRAVLLTGNPARQTLTGTVFGATFEGQADYQSEVALNLQDPRHLFHLSDTLGYPAVFNGKIHLSGDRTHKGLPTTSLEEMGVHESLAALKFNPPASLALFNTATLPLGAEDFLGHRCWVRTNKAGVVSLESTYNNEVFFASAQTFIAGEGATGNWLLYLPTAAPHAPFDADTGAGCPDFALRDDRPPGDATSAAGQGVFNAGVEDTDTRLATLVASLNLDPVTGSDILVIVGDNGCPADGCPPEISVSPPRYKSYPYPGGLGVPLIIVGAGIPTGSLVTANFGLEDLNATLIDLMGGKRFGPGAKSFTNCLDGNAEATACKGKTVIVQRFGKMGGNSRVHQLPPTDGDAASWDDDVFACIHEEDWLVRRYEDNVFSRGAFQEEFYDRNVASSPFLAVGDELAENTVSYALNNELDASDFTAPDPADLVNLAHCQRTIERTQMRAGRPAPTLGGGVRW